MTDGRRAGRDLTLAVTTAVMLWACGSTPSITPQRLPPGVASPSASPVAPPASQTPRVSVDPHEIPAAGLVLFTTNADGSGRLALADASGALAAATLPTPDVDWISAPGTPRLLATGTTGDLHLGQAVDETVTWSKLQVDATDLPGPMQFGALSPAGTRAVAGSGAFDGSGPFVLVVAEVDGSRSLVQLDREPSGPPSWLGPDRILIQGFDEVDRDQVLEIDPAAGIVATRPIMYWASAPLDGTLVAGLDPDTTEIRIVPSADWRAGNDGAGVRLPGTEQDGRMAERVAIDGTGTRIAVIWVDSQAAPVEIRIYDAGTGWMEVARLPIETGTDRAIVGWLE